MLPHLTSPPLLIEVPSGGAEGTTGTGTILTRMLRRSMYIYSTYIYVQTYRLWKRGGLAKDGITMTMTAKDGNEEYGGA